MDIQMESIYREETLQDPRKFIFLFDANYSSLYRFVARRIEEEEVRERIVRLVFMDAIGQINLCPNDVNFLTWLYKLAGERVSSYAKKGVGGMVGTIESPIFDGSGIEEGVYDDEYVLKQQSEAYFAILNYEEREIIRLKFFEELTDGEVMYIMDIIPGNVGKKIYQVLKRSYEILFGQVDEYAGVYYGELYGFLSRLKSIEKIPASESFKLKLKTEIINKLDKMYTEKFEDPINVGSSDPAKAFVYASKGMTKDEVETITQEYVASRSPNHLLPEEQKTLVKDKTQQEQYSQTEQVEKIPIQYNVQSDERNDEDEEVLSDGLNVFLKSWRVVFQYLFGGIVAFAVVFAAIVLFKNYPIINLEERLPIYYEQGFSVDKKDKKERKIIENDLIKKIVEDKEMASINISKIDEQLKILMKEKNGPSFDYVFDIKNDNVFRVRSFKEISN